MGRPKTVHKDLPPRMARRKLKGKTLYYYVHRDGSRPPLGDDLNVAKLKWAEIENGAIKDTIEKAAEVFKIEYITTKEPKTQVEYNRQIKYLMAVFGKGAFEDVAPKDIRRYLKNRSAKVAGNREISLFSAFFNWARNEGYTDAPNPCAGVDKNKESPRKLYIDDEAYYKVYQHLPEHIQDAMDMAYLTGQRVADVLKMTINDIREENKQRYLYVKQNKTGKEELILIEEDLDQLISRILSRKRNATGMHLIQTADGQRVGYDMLRYQFVKAREKAGVNYQFRDIRAKTASDMEDGTDLLGHTDKKTTKKHYNRKIKKVRPLKRIMNGL